MTIQVSCIIEMPKVQMKMMHSSSELVPRDERFAVQMHLAKPSMHTAVPCEALLQAAQKESGRRRTALKTGREKVSNYFATNAEM